MNNSPLKYGIVSEVKKGFVRVKFEDLDGIVSDWLPVLVRKSKTEKESWPLDVNEHVVCFMDEHLENGVCLGAIHNAEDTPDPDEAAGKFRKKFSDGTLIEYDKNSHKLTVDVKGSLEAKTTGNCSIDTETNLTGNAGVKAIVTAPNIELTGNVKITGLLTVTGAATMAGVAAASLAIAPGGGITKQGGGALDFDIETTGQVKGSEVLAGTVALSTHKHTAPSGGGLTSTPIP